MSYTLSFDRLAESLWVEFGIVIWRAPNAGAANMAGEIRDMENRRGVQIDSAFGVSHPVVEVVDVSKKFACVTMTPFGCPVVPLV